MKKILVADNFKILAQKDILQSDVYYTRDANNAEEILETSLKLELDEFSTEEDIEDIIKAIKKVADYYLEKKKNG